MRFLTLLLAATSVYLSAQEPAGETVAGTAAAITASKENPAAVERGGKLFLANCAGCHGATAKGGAGAPDLIRSLLVLDDEKGILISPVLRNGRPDEKRGEDKNEALHARLCLAQYCGSAFERCSSSAV